MPTGRPDYWYGTALYFEDSPSDGEVTRGPTSNWAYDHGADDNAHGNEPEQQAEIHIGKDLGTSQDRAARFYSDDSGSARASIIRKAGVNGKLQIIHYGTGDIEFYSGGANRLVIPTTGGVEEIWDDTPTNGELAKGVTSDWAFDHVNDVDAHHAKAIVFVDVGDAAAFHYAETDLTIDSSWNDLNIASYSGVRQAVMFYRIDYQNDTAGQTIGFRKNGRSNLLNACYHRCYVAGRAYTEIGTVITDSSGVIEYNAENGGTWDHIDIFFMHRIFP